MEFHGLPRKELQALCKKNKIPANMTNVAMADALAALPQVEGLGEISNPKEVVEIDTPAVQPRTAGRATTQRKPVKESETSKISTRTNRGARSGVAEEVELENKDVNVPVTTPAVVPCSRRRAAPAVSTRRKKEVIILDDSEEEEDDKNEVDEKPKDVAAKTPAVVPKSRTRAAGRSVRDKKEVPGGTSLQNAYSTRRSVRVLGKSLSKVSLVETEDKEQAKSEDVSEHGTSLQTESNEVSQNNEVEVSSVNKADSETKSHDSGSEAKSADAEDVLQAEPEIEGLENVNHVEAHEVPSLNLEDSFDTCVDSKEAESEQPEPEESGDTNEIENEESFGAEQDQAMEFAAPEDTPLEVTDQAIGDTDENENENESFGAKQDQAKEFAAPEETPLEVADQAVGDTAEIENKESVGAEQNQPMEFAAPEETPLEVADQAIATSTDVVSGDVSMEIADQEVVADLSVEASEKVFKGTAEQANKDLSVEASEEAPKETSASSTDVVSDDASKEVADQGDIADLSVEASGEAFKGIAEQASEEAIVGLSVEASDASKEISHQAIASSTDVVSDDASKEVADQEDVDGLSAEISKEAIKEAAELATVGLSVESSDEASKENSHQAIASSIIVVSDDASMEVNDQEDVAGLSTEISEEAIEETAELATVGLSVESSIEASQEISHQAIAPIDVVVPDDACVNNLDEGVADMVAEEVENIEGAVSAIPAEKDETFGRVENEGEKESSEVEKVILKLSMMDVSAKKEADQNNTCQKLEVEAQAEELGTEEHIELEDKGEGESNDVEKVILNFSMMDVSANKEADHSTSQKLEVQAQTEEHTELEAVVQINDQKTSDIAAESVAFEQIREEPICSPQSKEKLKTVQDLSMRSLKKLLKSGTKKIPNEIQAVSVESDMNKQLLKSGTEEISNESQVVTNVESDMNNPNTKKENSKTIDVQNLSMRGLKKLLKEKLDGKPAMSDNDDAQMQGVEKKRTALQALPQNQNQLAEQKAL